MKQFKTRLTSRGPGGAWTFLEVPFSVEKVFGSKVRIAVSGTMNGFAFQHSLTPNGDGTTHAGQQGITGRRHCHGAREEARPLRLVGG
jgi:Domain of unknown function (DUF1905)